MPMMSDSSATFSVPPFFGVPPPVEAAAAAVGDAAALAPVVAAGADALVLPVVAGAVVAAPAAGFGVSVAVLEPPHAASRLASVAEPLASAASRRKRRRPSRIADVVIGVRIP